MLGERVLFCEDRGSFRNILILPKFCLLSGLKIQITRLLSPLQKTSSKIKHSYSSYVSPSRPPYSQFLNLRLQIRLRPLRTSNQISSKHRELICASYTCLSYLQFTRLSIFNRYINSLSNQSTRLGRNMYGMGQKEGKKSKRGMVASRDIFLNQNLQFLQGLTASKIFFQSLIQDQLPRLAERLTD